MHDGASELDGPSRPTWRSRGWSRSRGEALRAGAALLRERGGGRGPGAGGLPAGLPQVGRLRGALEPGDVALHDRVARLPALPPQEARASPTRLDSLDELLAVRLAAHGGRPRARTTDRSRPQIRDEGSRREVEASDRGAAGSTSACRSCSRRSSGFSLAGRSRASSTSSRSDGEDARCTARACGHPQGARRGVAASSDVAARHLLAPGLPRPAAPPSRRRSTAASTSRSPTSVVCERCAELFATMDLAQGICHDIASGQLPQELRRQVLEQLGAESVARHRGSREKSARAGNLLRERASPPLRTGARLGRTSLSPGVQGPFLARRVQGGHFRFRKPVSQGNPRPEDVSLKLWSEKPETEI